MPDALPHLAFPVRFATLPDGSIALATVQQDTPAEAQADAAVVASCPRGHRDDLPAYGITPLVFQQGALDTERLATELAQVLPDLDLDADELLDLADATVRTVRVAALRPAAT